MISSDELERYMQQCVEQDAFSGVVLLSNIEKGVWEPVRAIHRMLMER